MDIGEMRGGRQLGYKDTKRRIYQVCRKCHKGRWVKLEHIKEPYYTGLCVDCARKLRRGYRFKEVCRHKISGGYIEIRIEPNDPFYSMARRVGSSQGYVKEHRLVMAKHLGRCLGRYELVHHLNGILDDNRIENLALMSLSEHSTLHDNQRWHRQ